MAIKERDIKLLWGRAGGKCAFPDCRLRLSEDKLHVSGSFPIGEQAHIVAEEASGPRGRSILTAEERNSYSNLILLCPTHHTTIDKNPEDWPVEKLHHLKREHELYIERTTSDSDTRAKAAELIYSTILDAAVEDCRLMTWSDWTSYMTAPSRQVWDAAGVEATRRFRERVVAAAWPGTYLELERALQTFALAIHTASLRFIEHAELDDEDKRYVSVRFYKSNHYDVARYERLLREYEQWVQDCEDMIIEATKAANWVADVVRRDLNPMFFAVEGRFLLHYSEGLGFRTTLFSYSEDDKSKMPHALLDRVRTILK